ncbi:MAG: L-rhamnose isomerase [Promethearchaeota archaeon]
MDESITRAYELAEKRYESLGIDTGEVLKRLETISISMQCWQGDDVGGFESPGASLNGGGIQATGNYPGKARTMSELRDDYLKAFSLIPGTHRVNIHAIYGEFGGVPVDRDQVDIEHFQGWVDWAKEHGLHLDFNSTLFSHPKASSGFTLSDKSKETREFWIKHVQNCREISEEIGKQQGVPCIHNLWIPDGSKDIPVDRLGHRMLLKDSLDRIFSTKHDPGFMKDAIEGKLFGIGSEAFVVGSHDFYLSYAIKNGVMLTMDLGHYHPTESVADKISSILPFTGELMLHVSRGVRWDSDHVVIVNDEVMDLAREIVRTKQVDKIHLALDFFDASINRIGAWVIGMRALQKCLLSAMLEPWELLKEREEKGERFQRLAILDELKTLPIGAVWDYFCVRMNVPPGMAYIAEIEKYEREVLEKRK